MKVEHFSKNTNYKCAFIRQVLNNPYVARLNFVHFTHETISFNNGGLHSTSQFYKSNFKNYANNFFRLNN